MATLVASIVLALGTSIFELAQKELTLSSIGRDSQYAFYAADTGAECALYWDVRFDLFGTSTPEGDAQCDGESLYGTLEGRPAEGDPDPYPYAMTFQFQPNEYCVNVSVEKSLTNGALRTTVRADGFSTACASVSESPRVLQRSVELHY